jgi:RNA polymerase sigma-70 factor (ECF subfamily)
MNSMHMITESELIALGKLGETAAVGELFERHYKTSLTVARRMLCSEAESEDAVQSAYCSAFQHLGSFRNDAQFKTWITRIVVNRCLMTIREPWRRITRGGRALLDDISQHDFVSLTLSPEKLAWRREVSAAHDLAISRLPEHLRAAYSLYAVSDMSVAEVAKALGLTLAATKSRIFRARCTMRTSLERVWRGEAVNRNSAQCNCYE